MIAALAAFSGAIVFAQATPSPEFEAASVKPAAPQANGQHGLSMHGGPGTSDPERIAYTNVSLMSLLRIAYDVYFYQIAGPEWLGVNGYDITAKIPPGATKEQFDRMLVNLLAERFHLALHHETKDVQGYELVTGKNGSKLKESALIPAGDAADQPGVAMKMKMAPNAKGPSVYLTFKAQPIPGLLHTISEELGRPVADKTGLSGKYDFTLEFAPEMRGPPTTTAQGLSSAPDETGPGIVTAIQEQLGLKLEPKKVPLDMLIVDSADKVPTEN